MTHEEGSLDLSKCSDLLEEMVGVLETALPQNVESRASRPRFGISSREIRISICTIWLNLCVTKTNQKTFCGLSIWKEIFASFAYKDDEEFRNLVQQLALSLSCHWHLPDFPDDFTRDQVVDCVLSRVQRAINLSFSLIEHDFALGIEGLAQFTRSAANRNHLLKRCQASTISSIFLILVRTLPQTAQDLECIAYNDDDAALAYHIALALHNIALILSTESQNHFRDKYRYLIFKPIRLLLIQRGVERTMDYIERSLRVLKLLADRENAAPARQQSHQQISFGSEGFSEDSVDQYMQQTPEIPMAHRLDCQNASFWIASAAHPKSHHINQLLRDVMHMFS